MVDGNSCNKWAKALQYKVFRFSKLTLQTKEVLALP
jgi:hypothetical protein